MDKELIKQVLEENEKLNLLKDKFNEYSELLSAFKFEKMKFMRAQDKFDAAIKAYEESEESDDVDLEQLQQEYQKWKERVAVNYESCQNMKKQGEAVLAEVNELRKQLDIKSGADMIEAVIEQRLVDNKKKLEVLQ